jgi:hypothetical protein
LEKYREIWIYREIWEKLGNIWKNRELLRNTDLVDIVYSGN